MQQYYAQDINLRFDQSVIFPLEQVQAEPWFALLTLCYGGKLNGGGCRDFQLLP